MLWSLIAVKYFTSTPSTWGAARFWLSPGATVTSALPPDGDPLGVAGAPGLAEAVGEEDEEAEADGGAAAEREEEDGVAEGDGERCTDDAGRGAGLLAPGAPAPGPVVPGAAASGALRRVRAASCPAAHCARDSRVPEAVSRSRWLGVAHTVTAPASNATVASAALAICA